jgi:hypothetical protein
MDNLTIAVIAIAVAQAVTILLTIGREREIKRLRELVAEQRILIVEIRAWLKGRMQSAQPRRIKPDREPIADDMRVPEPAITRVREPAITPKDLPDTRPRLTEDEIKEMVGPDKAREIVAVLHGTPPEKIG